MGKITTATFGALADRYGPYVTGIDSVLVPTAVQFELYKWVKRKRSESLAIQVIGLTEQGQVVPFTTSEALLAGDLSLQHRLSFADSLIYASA